MSKFDEILNSSNASDALLGEQIDKIAKLTDINWEGRIKIAQISVPKNGTQTFENVEFAVINVGRKYGSNTVSMNSTYAAANSTIMHIKEPVNMTLTSEVEGTITLTNTNGTIGAVGLIIYMETV